MTSTWLLTPNCGARGGDRREVVDFKEAEHPRAPEGKATGGQFVAKGGGGGAGAAGEPLGNTEQFVQKKLEAMATSSGATEFRADIPKFMAIVLGGIVHGKTSGVRLGSVPLNAFSNALYGQLRSNRKGVL